MPKCGTNPVAKFLGASGQSALDLRVFSCDQLSAHFGSVEWLRLPCSWFGSSLWLDQPPNHPCQEAQGKRQKLTLKLLKVFPQAGKLHLPISLAQNPDSLILFPHLEASEVLAAVGTITPPWASLALTFVRCALSISCVTGPALVNAEGQRGHVLTSRSS